MGKWVLGHKDTSPPPGSCSVTTGPPNHQFSKLHVDQTAALQNGSLNCPKDIPPQSVSSNSQEKINEYMFKLPSFGLLIYILIKLFLISTKSMYLHTLETSEDFSVKKSIPEADHLLRLTQLASDTPPWASTFLSLPPEDRERGAWG